MTTPRKAVEGTPPAFEIPEGVDKYAARDIILMLLQAMPELGADPDDPLAKSIAEAIRHAWDDAITEEWEPVVSAYRRAFGIDVRSEDDPVSDRTEFASIFAHPIAGGNEWFGRFINYCGPGKSTPQFYYGTAVTALAAGFGRKPVIDWEARQMYANLFTVLVGGTGAGKGSAIERALSVITPVMHINVLPQEGTAAGYALQLRSRYQELSEADALILAPEARTLLSRGEHKDAIVTWLTDWYDCPDQWSRALAGDAEYDLRNVYVSVLMASNMAWLRLVPQDAILGGFFPRFLTLDTPPEEEGWGVAMPRYDEKMRRGLEADITDLPREIPEKMRFDATASRWLDSWYAGPHRRLYQQTGDEQIRSWLNRKQAAMMKLATVMQLVEGGPRDVLAVEWLDRALSVCNWSDTAVKRVYGKLGVTKEGECLSDIEDMLQRRGGRISVKRLKRTLRNKHRAGKIDEAVRALVGMDEARIVMSPSEGQVVEAIRE